MGWYLQLQHFKIINNVFYGSIRYWYIVRWSTFCVLTASQVSQCCYILTHSMVQSPSWEANWLTASQEIPRISRNLKVHYRTHRRPPLVSILGQPNPVHIPTSHLLEIHPNLIHPSTPRSPHWSSSLRFPHQDPIQPPLLTHTRHMPNPSHSSRFYHQLYIPKCCSDPVSPGGCVWLVFTFGSFV